MGDAPRIPEINSLQILTFFCQRMWTFFARLPVDCWLNVLGQQIFVISLRTPCPLLPVNRLCAKLLRKQPRILVDAGTPFSAFPVLLAGKKRLAKVLVHDLFHRGLGCAWVADSSWCVLGCGMPCNDQAPNVCQSQRQRPCPHPQWGELSGVGNLLCPATALFVFLEADSLRHSCPNSRRGG